MFSNLVSYHIHAGADVVYLVHSFQDNIRILIMQAFQAVLASLFQKSSGRQTLRSTPGLLHCCAGGHSLGAPGGGGALPPAASSAHPIPFLRLVGHPSGRRHMCPQPCARASRRGFRAPGTRRRALLSPGLVSPLPLLVCPAPRGSARRPAWGVPLSPPAAAAGHAPRLLVCPAQLLGGSASAEAGRPSDASRQRGG